MMTLPDCPEIAHTLATGYPHDYDVPTCARCGCDFDRNAYEYHDEYYCKDCMSGIVEDAISNTDFDELVEFIGGWRVDVSDITF